MTPNRSFLAFQNYYFSCTRRISLLIEIVYTEKRSHIFKNNSIFRKKSQLQILRFFSNLKVRKYCLRLINSYWQLESKL